MGESTPDSGLVDAGPVGYPGFDPARPSSARIYNCLLGGKDHFAADRRAVATIQAVLPEVTQAAWVNRGFHQRAAIWMAQHGISQFLDLGCGLPPPAETTHQAVQWVNPAARVIYIDHDPMVIAHARALLTEAETTNVIQADLRDPASLLAAVHMDRLIELAEPTGLLATAVLDHIADEDDPRGCLARIVGALAPGSYVALSHLTGDHMPSIGMAAIVAAYRDAPDHIYPRSRSEVAAFLDGLDLMAPYAGAAPGLCRIGLWEAEDLVSADDESPQWWWASVARTIVTQPRASSARRMNVAKHTGNGTVVSSLWRALFHAGRVGACPSQPQLSSLPVGYRDTLNGEIPGARAPPVLPRRPWPDRSISASTLGRLPDAGDTPLRRHGDRHL